MAGLDVNARLTADASGFIGPMNKAAESATATGRAAARAARDAAQGQALAAKFAGDAVTEQSRRIIAATLAERDASKEYRAALGFQTRGNLDDVTAANALAAAYQKLTAAKLQTAAASKVAEAAQSSTHGYGDRVAASSVVRGLETGNVGIRAVEASLTNLVGSGVLQTAFSIIGPVAFAAAVGKGVYELYEFGQKAAEAGKATTEAFRDADDSARVASDDIQIRASKLQDQIDKLMGHPNNGMATALLEAAKVADELLPKLQANEKALEALLKEHNVSAFASALSGVEGTGQQSKEMLADGRKLIEGFQDITDEFDEYTAKLKDPKALQAASLERNRRTHVLFQSSIDTYKNEVGRLQKEQADSERDSAAAANAGEGSTSVAAINNSAKIADARGRLQQLRRLQRDADGNALVASLEGTVGGLKGRKEQGAEDHKAAEAQMKDFEGQLAARKMGHEVSIAEEYRFWETMAAAAAKYPENLLRVNEKIGQFRQEMLRKTKEEQKAAAAMASRDAEEGMRALEAGAKGMEAWKRSQRQVEREKTATVYTEDVQNAQNEAALRAIGLQHESGRSMTQLAAARELAAVHTREFNRAEADLLVNLKAIQDNTDLKPEERERATDAAQKNLNQFRNQRTVQVLQDQYSINTPDSSALVGAKDALESFTRAASDSARMMQDLVGHALEGVNRNLVEELTSRSRQGPRHLWTGLGKNLATEATGSALKQGEGLLLKSFGFGGGGKPDGTQARPMWVRMADALGSTVGKGASEAASGLGSLIGKVAPIFGLPGFADGVTNFGGGMAIVGERGPEILSLPRGSSVTPNHAINNGFSSGMTFAPVMHINGNADPAQTRAMVNQGLAEALPHFKAAAATHIADQKRRQVGNK